ncbi:hypothetical protein BO78DRAFT_418474 [Aspergillus sclerotiicarbonarius CBS 121057]|uniref:Uncharacterized protein n=1 Tax=Aspergillus sclerotiicarbonarius (strain CBS 121057 / IBT 28362) TaxID=1448318 RepID=A0A319EFR7_ASPSB|nr:hypothetical protein BO78DRAFT_418474 [Aspergillus sclerotiicarbonarius CBS 121057]
MKIAKTERLTGTGREWIRYSATELWQHVDSKGGRLDDRASETENLGGLFRLGELANQKPTALSGMQSVLGVETQFGDRVDTGTPDASFENFSWRHSNSLSAFRVTRPISPSLLLFFSSTLPPRFLPSSDAPTTLHALHPSDILQNVVGLLRILAFALDSGPLGTTTSDHLWYPNSGSGLAKRSAPFGPDWMICVGCHQPCISRDRRRNHEFTVQEMKRVQEPYLTAMWLKHDKIDAGYIHVARENKEVLMTRGPNGPVKGTFAFTSYRDLDSINILKVSQKSGVFARN